MASDSPLTKWIEKRTAAPPSGARFVGASELAQGLILDALKETTTQPILVVFRSRQVARNVIDNLTFFAGAEAADRIHYIPPLDFDFYRGLLLNPETLCERNVGLYHALNNPQGRVFVTTITGILQKTIPPTEYLGAAKVLRPNAEIERDAFILNLLEAGYQRQPAAYDPGVFAVRGGVIDIFSPLYHQPFRVEFFGDLIDEIRFFDAQTQLSAEKLEEAAILPVGQSLLPHGEDLEIAAEKIKNRLDHLEVPKLRRDELIEQIREGVLPSDYGFLFPLLSKGSASLLEYFPQEVKVVWDGIENLKALAKDVELPNLEKHFSLFEKEPLPIAERDQLFLRQEELEALLKREAAYSFEDFSSTEDNREWMVSSQTVSLNQEREAVRHKEGGNPLLEPFARRFREWMDGGNRIHIVCRNHTHLDRVRLLFSGYNLGSESHPGELPAFPRILDLDFNKLHLWQGFVSESGIFPSLKTVILSEEEIFGKKKRVVRAAAQTTGQNARLLASFKDIQINDFVVHRDHGIGRYLGLKSMNVQGTTTDFVLVEYKDGDKLYVPVYRLNVMQKYSGGEGQVPFLDKLGGDRWAKAKKKAEKAVAEMAAELLKIQAKRRLLPAHAFAPPNEDFRDFEMRFPFDETPDQLKAIEDVTSDLGKPHPMDRLVVGDVGYGKTEVAMRAAFRVALGGKQVAVLVPTTVLAFQHFENFKKRFTDTAVKVEMVSRLRSSAENKETLEKVKAGQIDIIIGTHRLLSSDVFFKDLGVVVVDEEHRFGVVHKERLKKLCDNVHVLSMTATPIPRTLNMAMTGIKDISIITTPPPDRLAVRTFVCRQGDEVVAEAISNELARDGQVFFVHNRIETIFKVGEELQRLLPRLKLQIVHGQMDGDELEQRMLAFYRGEYHMLLTTAIIESGLDVPRANTIIIDQADRFGLAQLYQLRGRVGRSEKRAYCYLLTPQQMTEDAKQRIQVIQRHSDLGAGFNIASHDLEIRGAGDLLGKEQSGHITAIGIDLYFDLLEESIKELQGQERKVDVEPEITLKIPAYFPEAFLPDISERIAIYRRLSAVETEDGISEVEDEIRDRFGNLPEEVVNLLGIMRLKLYLKKLHVVRMSCGPKRTSLQFAPTTPVEPARLIKLIHKDPKRYSITPDQKLVFDAPETDWRLLLDQVQTLTDWFLP